MFEEQMCQKRISLFAGRLEVPCAKRLTYPLGCLRSRVGRVVEPPDPVVIVEVMVRVVGPDADRGPVIF